MLPVIAVGPMQREIWKIHLYTITDTEDSMCVMHDISYEAFQLVSVEQQHPLQQHCSYSFMPLDVKCKISYSHWMSLLNQQW